MTRCSWCGDDPLYVAYHDEEWGVPLRDPKALFRMLTLEGFQAGLAWITILRKREAFDRAFAGFDPDVIAGWGETEVTRLLDDAGIVRHRGKIEAAIGNARAWRRVEDDEGFADLVWSVVDGRPRTNAWQSMSQVPAETAESKTLSKSLKSRGFRFVGATTCYAFMQAVGLVNDHMVDCFRYREVDG